MALDQPENQTSRDVEMGFLDHLEELRKRLFYGAFFILSSGIGMFSGQRLVVRCGPFWSTKLEFHLVSSVVQIVRMGGGW